MYISEANKMHVNSENLQGSVVTIRLAGSPTNPEVMPLTMTVYLVAGARPTKVSLVSVDSLVIPTEDSTESPLSA